MITAARTTRNQTPFVWSPQNVLFACRSHARAAALAAGLPHQDYV